MPIAGLLLARIQGIFVRNGHAGNDTCLSASQACWDFYRVGIAPATDCWVAMGVPHRVEVGGAAGVEMALSSARLYFGALTYPCTQFLSILFTTTCTGCVSLIS